jgi:hypothetical protein
MPTIRIDEPSSSDHVKMLAYQLILLTLCFILVYYLLEIFGHSLK